MKRQIVAQPALDPAALDALREWLAIAAPREEEVLSSLLRSALEMFESFTGIMALESDVEDVLRVSPDWQTLSAQPVRAITSLHGLPAEGAPFLLPVESYDIDIRGDERGYIRVAVPGSAGRVAVYYRAGKAAHWNDLPETIRQGVIRLAAHHYRDRDAAAVSPPPAAVTALWAPWRQLRLS